MEENTDNTYLVNYLFLIWLVLFFAKITHYIDWAWWIVFLPLSPIIVCAITALAALVFICVCGFIGALLYMFLKIFK